MTEVRTYLGGIRLPINPIEEVSFSVSGENKTFSVVALGEISELGNRNQISVSIKSLFVKSPGHFPSGDYILQFLKMIDDKKPIQFIITGGGFDTNMPVSIDSFKYDMPYGEDGDVYYSLSLKEYREHKVKTLVIKSSTVISSTSNSSGTSSTLANNVSSTSSALTNSDDYTEKRREVAEDA